MSRLLQRLARQALGTAGPRVRSLATMGTQMPVAAPAGEPIGGAASPATGSVRTAQPPASLTSREGARRTDVAASSSAEHLSIKETVAPPVPLHNITDPAVDRHVTFVVAPSTVERTTPAPPDPAPLLPEVAVATPAPVAGAIRPATPHETHATASNEPTEVHVHIGRIEVTALPAPVATPSKRRERTARPSVPLSDYLAKRRSS